MEPSGHDKVCVYPVYSYEGVKKIFGGTVEATPPGKMFDLKRIIDPRFYGKTQYFGVPTKITPATDIVYHGAIFQPGDGLFYGFDTYGKEMFTIGSLGNWQKFNTATYKFTGKLLLQWQNNLAFFLTQGPWKIEPHGVGPYPEKAAKEQIESFRAWLKLEAERKGSSPALLALWKDIQNKQIHYDPGVASPPSIDPKSCQKNVTANTTYAYFEKGEIYFTPLTIEILFRGNIDPSHYKAAASIMVHELTHAKIASLGLRSPSEQIFDRSLKIFLALREKSLFFLSLLPTRGRFSDPDRVSLVSSPRGGVDSL